MNCLLFLQCGLDDNSVLTFPNAVSQNYQLPEYTQVLFLILLDAPLPQFFIILQGIARATEVSNFLRLLKFCEGDGDVVSVVTPLVRGGAQVLHGDQVVEFSVQLEVQERGEVEEDGEGQVEVEGEDVENQGETHMYMDDT